MDRIGLRIKQLRDQKKLSQVELSRKLSVTQSSISRYESLAGDPDSAFLSGLSRVFPDISMTWLLTGEGDMFNQVIPSSQSSDPIIDIPVSCPIAAGSPIMASDDEPLEILHIPASLLHLPPPYFAFQVEGESMSPFILDKDIVILSRDWRGLKLNNRICGFRTLDGITLKKLVLQPRQKTAWLMPLNHTYEPTPYNKDTEELNLFGVLVLSIRKYT